MKVFRNIPDNNTSVILSYENESTLTLLPVYNFWYNSKMETLTRNMQQKICFKLKKNCINAYQFIVALNSEMCNSMRQKVSIYAKRNNIKQVISKEQD